MDVNYGSIREGPVFREDRPQAGPSLRARFEGERQGGVGAQHAAPLQISLPPAKRADLRQRSVIQRILRVYVVRADVRVGAAFAQADRETETDPVAHVLHVTGGGGLHPTPFVSEAACLEPELDAALALQRRPRLGSVRRRRGRERLAGLVADHGGADTVDLGHGRGPVPGPQRELGLDQAHLAAGREVDRRVPSRVLRGEEPGNVRELCGGYLGILAPPPARVAGGGVVLLVGRAGNADRAGRLVAVDPVWELV